MDNNYKDNMIVMHPNFKIVFTNHQPKQFRVLKLIKQQQTTWKINEPITWDGTNQSINGLKSIKASGLTSVLTETFKSMYEDCGRYVFDFIKDFFSDRDDSQSWNKSQYVPVPN